MKTNPWITSLILCLFATFSASCEPVPKQPDVPADLREVHIMVDSMHTSKELMTNVGEIGGAAWIDLEVLAFIGSAAAAEVEGLSALLASMAGGLLAGMVVVCFAVAVYLFVQWIRSLFETPGPSPARVAALNRPLSLELQQRESCQEMHTLAKAYEGKAEDFYSDDWQGMWADFEDHFEAAQDAAHVRVIANITGLDITVWPPLPPLPVLPHNHTPAEQHAFEAELSVWTQNNVHTIPHAKHAIEMEYSDMHFRETLNEIYLKTLPLYCLDEISETPRMIKKMSKLRGQKRIRDERKGLATKTYFEARNALTRAKLL